MSPLENLAITNCLLTESDVTHLSQCPCISQLKGLDLSGITLTHFSPYILQVLLEKVASTLQELYLEKCGIVDPQLEAILPALSHCSALTSFSVRGTSSPWPSCRRCWAAPQDCPVYAKSSTLPLGRVTALWVPFFQGDSPRFGLSC